MSWIGTAPNKIFERTNGTNTGTGTWGADAINPRTILSSRHDTHDNDIATGLNNCLCKNGDNAATGNISMANFKFTNVGNATLGTDFGKVSQIQNSAYQYLTNVAGSVNAITANAPVAISAYITGQIFYLYATGQNTGAVTLNINGLGAKNVLNVDTIVGLRGSEIRTGGCYILLYDGTQFLLLNPSRGAIEYAPTFGINGTGTYTSVSAFQAVYSQEGRFCNVRLAFSGTVGGILFGSGNYLTVSLPHTSKNGAGDQIFMCSATHSTTKVALALIPQNSTECRVYADDNYSLGTNWSTGGSRGANVSLRYYVE